MMTSARIGEYFYTIQTHMNMWTNRICQTYTSYYMLCTRIADLRIRSEELFASLRTDTGIFRAQDGITKGHLILASDVPNNVLQVVLLNVPGTHPRGKIAHLSVVSIVCERHLGTYKEHFTVVDQNAAVITDIVMSYWHPDIQKNILAVWIVNHLGQHLPRMQESVSLEEVVETAITSNFKLWSDT